MFLRNHFKAEGIVDIPIITKQDIDLKDLRLIGYDKTKLNDEKNIDSIVHFFLDDYKFEVIWNNPEPRIEKLSQYKGVLAPAFSTYYTMPNAMQIFNTFRSRWCAAYLQSKGLTVIPTVSWGKPESYWYCFDGIEKGSIVAISTLGVKKEKDFFLMGYNEMQRRIEPKAVICYCSPFPEMKGNIISVDYAETNNIKPHKNSCLSNSKKQPNLIYRYIKKTQGYIVPNKGLGGGGGIGKPGFPGWDPAQSPGKGYEWRGKGDPSSGKGSWYNPNTKEMLHPDLEHPEPYGPHWDYNYPGGGNGFRIYPDGSMTPKNYEGDIFYA